MFYLRWAALAIDHIVDGRELGSCPHLLTDYRCIWYRLNFCRIGACLYGLIAKSRRDFDIGIAAAVEGAGLLRAASAVRVLIFLGFCFFYKEENSYKRYKIVCTKMIFHYMYSLNFKISLKKFMVSFKFLLFFFILIFFHFWNFQNFYNSNHINLKNYSKNRIFH